ncbi:AAA family ATPase [Paenibacillus sp. LHD-38]|uniref:AAA family ATPase n=1 Tax=Paenibacillus sp. LHD-38 TaxID=3072143 RepID=UPI00280FDF53|nr:AAA family ATPase [Paenibacillus sp. LHD-38]MDQ8735809.1 AAA family ATPase [Paenibacillus sp. LHD-38]
MIRKIISIKNTGKFRSCAPKGDLQLNKFNIVYSENGRGKTTLSNIFRSLQEQDESLVIGRRTLGGGGEQAIDLLSDSGKLMFKQNKWISKPNFDIEIFDSQFVSQNVYSKHIEHEQKKQLYLFTIGKQGVDMADRLLALDEELKKENAEKKEKEKELLHGVQGVLSAADFIRLSLSNNIDDEILDQSRMLRSSEREGEIKSKPSCIRVALPAFDKTKFLSNISSPSLKRILDNAEQLTKQHMKQNLDQHGEQWLEYGVSKISDHERCPFCDQEINDVTIVEAFKTYFSDEYKKAIHSVKVLEAAFAKTFSIEAMFTLQKHVASNLELIEYWKTYASVGDPTSLDWEHISKTWEQFTYGIRNVIEAKKLAPLEELVVSDDTIILIDKYLLLMNELTAYNDANDQINKIIEERKTTVNKIKIQDIKSRLSYLSNVKLRFSDGKVALVEEYKRLLSSIKNMDNSKSDYKTSLNTYTAEIFSKYEERINHHLVNCGASYKISDFKSSFQGGKPSSNFILNINNVAVDLGNEKSPLTAPSFKNTLSEGDKSSLAFAFFLAKLESDPEINNKVIIFDDPISSLDSHRKSYTADQVMKFSALAKQVIVLTHDMFFARVLWGKFADKKTLLTQLCIKRDGIHDSTIDSWDIEAETRSDYYQLYFTLADFLEGKPKMNHRSVAMCIRPILEGNLRVRFPQDFSSNEWLGGFIQKVRTTNEVHLLPLKSNLTDLEDINDYSKKYHHDQNPFAESEAINEQELLTYVQRTLLALKGLHNAVI